MQVDLVNSRRPVSCAAEIGRVRMKRLTNLRCQFARVFSRRGEALCKRFADSPT